MATIKRLPDDVISRIAAGEVIERPASVLKELIENSLDAGSSRIIIESKGAGRELLRVVDDGQGIPKDDLRLAFERHATSKIRSFEDLDRLSTFGFRGEALFSIAAVSKTTLSSTPKGSKTGWTVSAEGGMLKSEREAPPVPGASVEVKDLFFNTPARSKFLKKDPSEKAQLLRVIEEAALANPSVSFSYSSDGRKSLDYPAAKGLPRRVDDVLGEDGHLLEVEEDWGGLSLKAFLAPASRLSASRALQYLFVNKRPVASRILQQALYRAYEPFRSKDRHPVAVVFVEAPPERVDVNVHPAKREVRFREERPLFELLAGACSAALLKDKGIPALTPGPRHHAPTIISDSRPRYAPAPVEAPSFSFDSAIKQSAPPALNRWYTPPFRFMGQVEQAYLVFEAAGGLLVVDQHAAQERLLYERYLGELEGGKVKPQKLMLPLAVELPASQVQAVLARSEDVEGLGFELSAFGKTTLHVTAAPAVFKKDAELKETVHRLLESWTSGAWAAKDAHAHAAAMVACKAAVKAHDRLGEREALRLLEDLKDLRDPTACPHGRPSMISLSRDELARRFKRPGAPPI